MNFIDLAILLAYFKSDEHFYHINSNELLNYSFCLEYCHTLDATLPAYTEKPWIQKFIFQIWFQKYIHSKAHQFTSDCTVFPDLNFEFETIAKITPMDILVLSNSKVAVKT